MSISSIFKSIVATVGAALGYFFGEIDGFVYALITFIVIDYITGIMRAIIKKELSSDIGFRGIFKKICIFIIIGIGHMLDNLLFGEAGVLRSMIITFYIANEGISIVENMAFLGVPIPTPLLNTLQQLKKKNEQNKEN